MERRWIQIKKIVLQRGSLVRFIKEPKIYFIRITLFDLLKPPAVRVAKYIPLE